MRSARKALKPVVAVVILGASTWGMVTMTRLVMEGRVQGWDDRVLHAMRDADDAESPRGPLVVEHAARDLTALGSMTVIILMTGAMSGFFFLLRRRRDGLLLIGAVVSGMGAFFLLKHLVGRERPPLMSPIVYTESPSFPSGHVMLAAVMYFALAILICRHIAQFRVRAFVWWTAVALVVAIALTRTYLGIHWPSDVVGGLLTGIGWTALWWMVGWWTTWQSERATGKPEPLLGGSGDGAEVASPLSVAGADGAD